MGVVSLLDRPIYRYSEVDRLIGLPSGTARRWINGYNRGGKPYEPILRLQPAKTEWVTWGEFVETRILAEYRDQNIPTARLRGAVVALRRTFEVDYPLAHMRPYLAAAGRELAIEHLALDPTGDTGLMELRTGQIVLDESDREVIDLLLEAPGKQVMEHAVLAKDERGEQFAAELTMDYRYPGIVISPDRSSGQPTFAGRRVTVSTVAGLVDAGEAVADIAADFGLSVAQVEAAVACAAEYGLAA